MPTTDGTKPTGKSGRRKGKGEPRKKASSQQSLPASPATAQPKGPDQDHELRQQSQSDRVESPKVDQPVAVEEPVVAVVASPEIASPERQPAAAPSAAEPPPPEPSPAEPTIAAPAEAKTAAPSPAETVSPELAPVSLQTIANAYRDYTRKSIEDFGSFVEQLSGVRTLDKAMTVQSEFVKRAYETSVAESQKICELHNKLAKQTFQPFQGLMGKTPDTRRKS